LTGSGGKIKTVIVKIEGREPGDRIQIPLPPAWHLRRVAAFVSVCVGGTGFEMKCGFPERFAQQALGHNSKAVHRAYAKNAAVTVPSLTDWERDWQENPQRSAQSKLLPVNFQ
jgi:hypothetical protein